MSRLHFEPYSLPGAPLGPENPLPFFRAAQPHQPLQAEASLPPELRVTLGQDTAFRVLPYLMQDDYARDKQPLTFQAAVLENEHLRATFLPQLGGRLMSLRDLDADRELLHQNPVFQPANLAIRNAWFSGGVEWNVGQFGHTFSTAEPVFAAQLQAPDGSPVLRLYEYERVHGLLWQLDVHLPDGAKQLTVYTRVVNPNTHASSMYWWTNTAVNERPGLRILASARQAITNDWRGDEPTFGLADMPFLPTYDGADATYAGERQGAAEYFLQTQQDFPFQAAVEPDGSGLFEASTPPLSYRKVFVWGQGAGGRRWQRLLAQPGEAYLEIQAGLAPSQVHALSMPGGAQWDWVQVFGPFQGEPGRTHGPDYPQAVAEAGRVVRAQVSPEELTARLVRCRALADQPATLVQSGSGWGALERQRREQMDEAAFPAAFDFPDTSLGAEQAPWLRLLESGALPAQNPQEPPPSFLVDPAWMPLLEQATHQPEADWSSWLLLGVAQLELSHPDLARRSWLASRGATPNAWAERNLAVLAEHEGRLEDALKHYAGALRLLDTPLPALTEEYLGALVRAEDWPLAASLVARLNDAERVRDRIRLHSARVLLESGQLAAAEALLAREFAGIREGETETARLWHDLKARELAARSGRDWRQVKAAELEQFPLPPHLDFGMRAEAATE